MIGLEELAEQIVRMGAQRAFASPSAFLAQVDGRLVPMARAERDLTELVTSVLSNEQRRRLADEGSVDFAVDAGPKLRVHGHAAAQLGGLTLVIDVVPSLPPSLEALGAPADVSGWCSAERGLVIVASPTRGGNSWVLAALAHEALRRRPLHLVTVEAPISWVFPEGPSLSTQREVGVHVRSFADGLSCAERDDSDVVLTSDLPDRAALEVAMRVAESRLVLAGLEATSAVDAMARVSALWPEGGRERARERLAFVLLGFLAVRNLGEYGANRGIFAFEVTHAGRVSDRRAAGEALGPAPSSSSLDDELAKLVAQGAVSVDVAMAAAIDPAAMAQLQPARRA